MNGRIWFVCFFTLHGKEIKFFRSFSLSYLVWNFLVSNGITLMGFHKVKMDKDIFLKVVRQWDAIKMIPVFVSSWAALVISNISHLNFVIISLAVLLKILKCHSNVLTLLLIFNQQCTFRESSVRRKRQSLTALRDYISGKKKYHVISEKKKIVQSELFVTVAYYDIGS